MKDLLIGIDVGTTGTKTLLMAKNGRVLARAYRDYPLSTPHVGWSEQNAMDWWNAIAATVREVCAGGVSSRVAAISLSTQGGTLVPVDAAGVPLRPAIVWNDQRGTEQRDRYLREVGDDASVYEKTGWHLLTALLSVAIRWVRDEEPEVFEKTKMFLSVPDFVSYHMTGIAAADLSNQGINQLCDIRREVYDKEILAFDGITEAQLPKIVHSGDTIGTLTEKAAEELGLSSDVVLVAGAHDQYAVALGAGVTNPGDLMIGSGTCWVITSIADKPDFSSGLAQSVAAVPGMWGSIYSLSSGGVCLDWMRKAVICGADGTRIPYEDVNRMADSAAAAEEGLFFYPFSGKCGKGRSFRKASFVGLDLSHGQANMVKAVMEGVAFQVKWMMEEFSAKPTEAGIKLAGGASKSTVWSQIVSDVTGCPVRIPAVADLSCVGAAILAGTGAGVFASLEEGCRCMRVEETVILPDAKRVQAYAPLYEQYKKQAEDLDRMYEK